MPPSKKSLNFHNENVGDNGVVLKSVLTNNNHVTRQIQSKKRDCEAMFLPLSNDEKEDAYELNSIPGW